MARAVRSSSAVARGVVVSWWRTCCTVDTVVSTGDLVVVGDLADHGKPLWLLDFAGVDAGHPQEHRTSGTGRSVCSQIVDVEASGTHNVRRGVSRDTIDVATTASSMPGCVTRNACIRRRDLLNYS